MNRTDPTEPAGASVVALEAALVEALTSLWRARRKLEAGDGSGDQTRRQATRHLRAAIDALAGAGWSIQDHDGAPFDAGLALEVIAYEPREDVPTESVLETVRPCIYCGARRVQIGQVIVAKPEKSGRRRTPH
jgi:hypothetical protein